MPATPFSETNPSQQWAFPSPQCSSSTCCGCRRRSKASLRTAEPAACAVAVASMLGREREFQSLEARRARSSRVAKRQNAQSEPSQIAEHFACARSELTRHVEVISSQEMGAGCSIFVPRLECNARGPLQPLRSL